LDSATLPIGGALGTNPAMMMARRRAAISRAVFRG
jgi:hypothetical protein